MKQSDEGKSVSKGKMSASGSHEFFVVNLTDIPLTGKVSWNDAIDIDVNGLVPGTASELKQFAPKGGTADLWHYSVRGRSYQLNVYDADRYTVVVISNYGIGVLVTATSPDTWKW